MRRASRQTMGEFLSRSCGASTTGIGYSPFLARKGWVDESFLAYPFSQLLLQRSFPHSSYSPFPSISFRGISPTPVVYRCTHTSCPSMCLYQAPMLTCGSQSGGSGSLLGRGRALRRARRLARGPRGRLRRAHDPGESLPEDAAVACLPAGGSKLLRQLTLPVSLRQHPGPRPDVCVIVAVTPIIRIGTIGGIGSRRPRALA